MIRWADDLAFKFGGKEYAVDLCSIAKAAGIFNVSFRPLLVTGCLAKSTGGLRLIVSCDESEAAMLTSQFLDNGGRQLPARIRFTIAHEIAHTFFLDSNHEPAFDWSHHASLNSLEQACDLGASHILLPSFRIDAELEDPKFISGMRIRRLVEACAVSWEAFVIRLSQRGLWGGSQGLVILCDNHSGSPVIKSIAADNFTKPLIYSDLMNTDYGAFKGEPLANLVLSEPCEEMLSNGEHIARVSINRHLASRCVVDKVRCSDSQEVHVIRLLQ